MEKTGTDIRQNAERILRLLGGSENILTLMNCMTRLRITVESETSVDEEEIRGCPDVLMVVHDREKAYEIVLGPGKCKKYADMCALIREEAKPSGDGEYLKRFHEEHRFDTHLDIKKKASGKNREFGRIREILKVFGDIFVPLIPGVIAAGLCAGFASLITQLVPDYDKNTTWSLVYNILSLIQVSFMTYLTAWVGYRTAERFGATPILGGMLGMITSVDGINQISSILGLYNKDVPLDSTLCAGKGGVLAVVAGVMLLSWVEKRIRKHMPETVDIIFTPLLTLLICVIPYVLLIMPLFGFVSNGIVWLFSELCLSSSIYVRLLVGFVSSAVFLPLVATGMHHGLIALYTVQLQTLGYVTLYPAFAMAGAGQVGAALAIRHKAKKAGDQKLCSIIHGALPAGFLGIGEPLIYGVTLPLGKPFLTAGLGAGFGGALVMAMEVASTTWGPSGLLGAFVMTAGPNGGIQSVLVYLGGLVVSYIASYVITYFTFHLDVSQSVQGIGD